MSERYPGGVISKTPPTITPPVDGEGGSASGVWTLADVAENEKVGTWPKRVIPRALYAWGDNSITGGLGLGDRIDRSSPVQVGALTNWAKISDNISFHSLAITNTGELYAWGYNNRGQLGTNNQTTTSSPVQVGALTNWSKVSTSNEHTLAVKTDGTLWSWGDNGNGELGLNLPISNDRSSPVQVGAETNWADVFTYEDQSFAITTTGELYAWGDNTSGELGDNSRIFRSSPVQIGAGDTWSDVGPAVISVVAVTTDGKLFSWGNNGQGELGLNLPINNDRSSPIQVGALTNWSSCSGGHNYHVAIKTDGTMWSWGFGSLGRLGQNDTVIRSSPTQIGADTDWSKVSAGRTHSLSTKTNNTLWAWGDNGQGQLGLGDSGATDRSSPVQIGSDGKWNTITAGNFASLAFLEEA